MRDRECVDLNECVLNTHNCDVHAECLNREGSFECLCDEEYVGDGITCQRDPSILRTGSFFIHKRYNGIKYHILLTEKQKGQRLSE